jgi:hypothetical protein
MLSEIYRVKRPFCAPYHIMWYETLNLPRNLGNINDDALKPQKSATCRGSLAVFHYSLCTRTGLCNSTVETDTLHYATKNINMLLIVHVSTRLGLHQGEYVEYVKYSVFI